MTWNVKRVIFQTVFASMVIIFARLNIIVEAFQNSMSF